MISRRSSGTGSSANAVELRPVFIRHVHELLALGFRRLKPSLYRTAQEEEITGDLKGAVEVVLDERPKKWMIHYFIGEEAPVNDGRRKGKRRRKVDIHVASSRHIPRAKFSIEAKPLGPKRTVATYLSSKGIGRFLSGAYASDADEAGMLGYLQSGSHEEWFEKLALRCAKKAAELEVDANGISPYPIVPELPATYRSIHERKMVGRPIHIYRTLLLCR